MPPALGLSKREPWKFTTRLEHVVTPVHISTSPKKFSKGKQAHVGMERSKTSRTRWERHHNTFTPSLHLVPFCQLCFVFVSCVHRRVEEGSGEGIAVCCAC